MGEGGEFKIYFCYSVWDLRTLAQFQGSEMSLGLFKAFMVLVPGVTQGNEDAGSVQDFILLVFFGVNQEY